MASAVASQQEGLSALLPQSKATNTGFQYLCVSTNTGCQYPGWTRLSPLVGWDGLQQTPAAQVGIKRKRDG